MNEAALVLRGISRRFGRRWVLRGVDLDVFAGEALGLTGRNGSGKTTLLRICATLLRPTRGDGTIFDARLLAEPGLIREKVGYLAHDAGLYGNLTARENLILAARLYGVADPAERANTLLEEQELTGVAERQAGGFSRGMSQRLSIARGLVHDPEIVLLDEPFSGLDPVNVALVTDLIEERRARGLTTVLSTHMMHQVEALCDRVALIHRGCLIVYGQLAEIQRRYSPHEVIIWTTMDLLALGMRATQHKPGGWRVELPPSATPAAYLTELVRNGVVVDRYEPLVARMDEIFVNLVSEGR